MLLRRERGLPPGQAQNADETEGLRRQNEALKREVEELKMRLEEK